jgi:hypothetical protein
VDERRRRSKPAPRLQLTIVVFRWNGKIWSHGSTRPGYTLCNLPFEEAVSLFVDGTDRLTCVTCAGIVELQRHGPSAPANIRVLGAPTAELFAPKESRLQIVRED